MAEMTVHAVYMGLTFRPLVRADGTVGRVGVQALSPACIDAEVYPNLLTAAPSMYQALTLLKGILDPSRDAHIIENIETVLAFAQNGYLGGTDIAEVIRGLRK